MLLATFESQNNYGVLALECEQEQKQAGIGSRWGYNISIGTERNKQE